MTTLVGIRTLESSGTSKRRRQALETFGGTLRLDYRWILGGFEPGVLLTLDQGPGATLKLAQKNDVTSVLSLGPELAYRWQMETNQIVGFVASTIDVNVPQQNNITVLAGLQFWFKASAPELPATKDPEPPAPEPKPAVVETKPEVETPAPSQPEKVVTTSMRFKPDVFQFELGTAQLTKTSQTKASAVADALKAFVGSWSHIDIEGHTDSKGDPEKNRKLSEDRAQGIRTFLINHGIPEAGLTAKGFGSDRPLAHLAPTAPENRRVELQFHNLQNTEALGKALNEFVVLEEEKSK
jgi:outer membrane protein OmpA-like peptidoglycan-associated protein